MAAQSEEPGIKANVIVVEDLISMRKAIRRILDHDGLFNIEEFSSAKEAIEYLKNHSVDLVIADIFMPGGSGWDILRYIRARSMASDTPVLFLTGEATKDDIVYSIDKGVDGYLIKPFEATDLLANVKNILEKFRNPQQRELQIRQAESCFIKKDFAQAESIFSNLHSAFPQSARICVGLAQAVAVLGKKDLAFQLLDESIRLSPIYFNAYAVKADLLLGLGQTDEAIEYILKELTINGKQPQRRILLSELFCGRGDNVAAAEQLRQALLDDPRDEEVLIRNAEFLFGIGETEKSILAFLKARRKVPHCTRALNGISKVCVALNIHKRAVNLFTDMLKLNPAAKDVVLARARVCEKMGDYRTALGDVDAFLLAEPEMMDALILRGRLLAKLNLNEEALAHWLTVLKLKPNSENFGRVGLAYLRVSKFVEAIKNYEKALESDKLNTKFLFNLAFSYESIKKLDTAVRFYDRVRQIAPQSKEAAEATQRILGLKNQKIPRAS